MLLRLQRTVGNRSVQRIVQRFSQANAAGDEHEAEAERVAQQVAAAPAAIARTADGDAPGHVGSDIETARQGGEGLDEQTQSSMEHAFGADLSRVRVHTGSEAGQMNRALGARAFTTGSDIFFGPGSYDPNSQSGRHLLAHELTHVVQQGGATPSAQPMRQLGAPLPRAVPPAYSPQPAAASISAAPYGVVQAAPVITAITSPADVGVGRSIGVEAVLAAAGGKPPAVTWSLVAAPAGVTIAPAGKKATITASKGAKAAAGGTFKVQAALTKTPADSATSGNINLVGITKVTFTAAPAFTPIAALGGPFPFPPNTADPNTQGVAGNTATVAAVTAPAGRAVTVSLKKALGGGAAGTTVTPGTETGDMLVKVEETASKTFEESKLPINPVPLQLSAFTAQGPHGIAGAYGPLNTIAWKRSDKTANPLTRIVGETITAGAHDDFGLTKGINPPIGPNAAPTLKLAVPANAWSDQLATPIGAAAGAAGDANPINVNKFVGPGVAKKLPARWFLRQGFHWHSWAGAWSTEFDNGTHQRSLIQSGAKAFKFQTDHVFPAAKSGTWLDAYVGPPLIVFSGITATPLAPAAAGWAADGVATANLNVVSSVPGRKVVWSATGGGFAVPGAPAAVGTPAVGTAGAAAGSFGVKVADTVFPNRQLVGKVTIQSVNVSGMTAPVAKVPAGTNTAVINLSAAPGGRTVNFTVDAASAAKGVTVLGVVPGAANAPARGAKVTSPAGFKGKVTVTAADSVLPAKKASVTITFK